MHNRILSFHNVVPSSRMYRFGRKQIKHVSITLHSGYTHIFIFFAQIRFACLEFQVITPSDLYLPVMWPHLSSRTASMFILTIVCKLVCIILSGKKHLVDHSWNSNQGNGNFALGTANSPSVECDPSSDYYNSPVVSFWRKTDVWFCHAAGDG